MSSSKAGRRLLPRLLLTVLVPTLLFGACDNRPIATGVGLGGASGGPGGAGTTSSGSTGTAGTGGAGTGGAAASDAGAEGG